MQLKLPLPGRADAPGAEWGEAWRSRTGRSTVTHAGMRCPGSRAPLNTHPWVQPGFTRASPSQPPPHHCRRAAAPETSGNGSSPKTQVLPLCFEGRPPLPSWSLSLPPMVTQIILSPHNFISFSFPPTHSPFSALTLTQSPSAHPAPFLLSTPSTSRCVSCFKRSDNHLPPPCHGSHLWASSARSLSRSQCAAASPHGAASSPGTRAGLARQQRSPTAGTARAGVLALERDPSRDMANARARWRRGGARGLWRGRPDGGTHQQRNRGSLCLLPPGPAPVFAG